MKTAKRILICPLDWGLGHASRCIPIIHYLLGQKHEVVIAAAAAPLALLKQEFPQLEWVTLEGYNISYSKRFLWLKLLLQAPKIFSGIYREHREVKKICAQKKMDVLISDNRFGCWNSAVTSIFITHQVFIRAPYFQNSIRAVNFWIMKKYTRVWIPDVNGFPNFSGKLSHEKNIPEHASYIGLLSRFSLEVKNSECNQEYKICAWLSGPEPQRTMLETLLIRQITELKLKAIVVRGLPNEVQQKNNSEYITFENHLPKEKIKALIEASEIVVSRSGYSTIMDLAVLGKKAIFIPTPAQTEQEYLAAYFSEQKICFTQEQTKFDLQLALQESIAYKGFEAKENKLDLSRFDL